MRTMANIWPGKQNGKAFAFPWEGAPECFIRHSMGCFHAHIQSRVLSHPVPSQQSALFYCLIALVFQRGLSKLLFSLLLFNFCCYYLLLLCFLCSVSYCLLLLFVCFNFLLSIVVIFNFVTLFIICCCYQIFTFNSYCLQLLWRSKSSTCASFGMFI